MPFFSVVIPVYNKANYIAKTLESVSKQSFQDFEVIIVNDGSTDQSLEIIQQIEDKRFKIYNQINKGASQARNVAVSYANSEWITLLDADDIWFENHLEILFSTIQKLPKADVISTGYQIELKHNYIKTPVYSKPISREIEYVDNYFEFSFVDPLFWTSTLCFKKSCFEKIGGFDTNLKTGQDLDLVIRFALNFKLGYNPEVTLSYKRYSENNLSSHSKLHEKQKYIDKYKNEEKTNEQLKHYLDINRYSLALQAKIQNNNTLFKSVKSEINRSHLSSKQILLLGLPAFVLRSLKSTQQLLIKFGLYLSAFD